MAHKFPTRMNVRRSKNPSAHTAARSPNNIKIHKIHEAAEKIIKSVLRLRYSEPEPSELVEMCSIVFPIIRRRCRAVPATRSGFRRRAARGYRLAKRRCAAHPKHTRKSNLPHEKFIVHSLASLYLQQAFWKWVNNNLNFPHCQNTQPSSECRAYVRVANVWIFIVIEKRSARI